MSEREATGKLTNTPGIVEAEKMRPVQVRGVPRDDAKGPKTGFLDIVVLRIARNPIMHKVKKKLLARLLRLLSGFAIILESSLLLSVKLFFFLHHLLQELKSLLPVHLLQFFFIVFAKDSEFAVGIK